MKLALLGTAVAVAAAAIALAIDDQITLVGVTAADAPVLLVKGRRGSGCVTEKEAVHSLPQVVLPNLLAARTPVETCPSEIALFSREHAVLLVSDPSFTSQADAIPLAAPGPRLDVPLNVVVISDNPTTGLNRANEAVAEAITRYNENRVGLRFVPGTVQSFATGDAAVAGVGRGCESVDGVRASGVYDPSKLNVYFVPAIDMPNEDDVYGYNCFEYGASDIIYISLDYSIPPTLSHEIGHALSLRGVHGHVSDNFDEDNLMETGLDPETTRDLKSFTLGQAYRMNADAYSWLNLKVGQGTIGVSLRRGEIKGCQDVLSAVWPCVRLKEAWPK